MIRFGLWSTLLLAGSLHGLIVALLLLRSERNRLANRFLAALLAGVVLLITPYTIGYAGFYDVWPWLSFAPFFWQLSFGPSLWLYIRQIGHRGLPRGWGWHYAPAAIQGAYYLGAFNLPLELKATWNARGQEPWVAPFESVAIIVSVVGYGLAALGQYRHYQRWLVQHTAAREEYRLDWLRAFLVALALATSVALGFGAYATLVHRLDYFDRFPLYLAFTGLVYFLGIAGWRHADDAYPEMEAMPAPEPPTAAIDVDWAERGRRWARQIEESGWWREPDVTLGVIAGRLGTNTSYLSRALNDGLGQSFSEAINRMRVIEAQRRLSGNDSILDIALEVGFGSKASFNRAFRLYTETTPSAFRQTIASQSIKNTSP